MLSSFILASQWTRKNNITQITCKRTKYLPRARDVGCYGLLNSLQSRFVTEAVIAFVNFLLRASWPIEWPRLYILYCIRCRLCWVWFADSKLFRSSVVSVSPDLVFTCNFGVLVVSLPLIAEPSLQPVMHKSNHHPLGLTDQKKYGICI